MSKEQQPTQWDEHTQNAIAELQRIICHRYPTASFRVGLAEDDPQSIHITTIVDVDDPDEVGDLVLDRVLELQEEEGLPIHVIPIRTPERVLAELQAEPATARRRPGRMAPLFGGLRPGHH
jgi:hypothetical protein